MKTLSDRNVSMQFTLMPRKSMVRLLIKYPQCDILEKTRNSISKRATPTNKKNNSNADDENVVVMMLLLLKLFVMVMM